MALMYASSELTPTHNLQRLASRQHTNPPPPRCLCCCDVYCRSLGADGVMVPLVNSKAEAQQAVSYCYFPPEGLRSAAYPVRCGSLLQHATPASLSCIVQHQQRKHMLKHAPRRAQGLKQQAPESTGYSWH